MRLAAMSVIAFVGLLVVGLMAPDPNRYAIQLVSPTQPAATSPGCLASSAGR